MKNIKVKIKNEGEDGKLGSEESPMVAGCSARGAEGAGRDGDGQSPGAKVQSQVAGEAEFEDWRSKTSFSPNAVMVEGGISLATDHRHPTPTSAIGVHVGAGSHGCTQIGTGADKKDFLTAEKAGSGRMVREKVLEGRACVELSQGAGLFHVAALGDERCPGEVESRTRTRMTTRTKNRNDEGMAIGALCLFVPPDGCGGLGSPGKSAVVADLAGAVHDAVGHFESWARFGAMRFWTAAAGTGSKVCRAASRGRRVLEIVHILPLLFTFVRSFDNKNIFGSGNPVRSGECGARNE